MIAGEHVAQREFSIAQLSDEPDALEGEIGIAGDGRDAQRLIAEQIELPAGYSISWAGQYQYLERAQQRLTYIIPVTLFIILILLYLSFRSIAESLMIMLAVPLALVGGVWLLWLLQFHLSVAAAVGFIALAGVAAEFGVVMIVYLREAVARRAPASTRELREAVVEGAALRVRPKAMTAAVIIAGLMPIMLGTGTGSEVMQRIAAPMIGGMVTAPLVSMLLIPVMYFLWKQRDVSVTALGQGDEQ